MRSVLRSVGRWVLVWLMVLALPIQGFAAASMQHCASGQRQQALSGVAPSTDGHGHAEAGAVPPCHSIAADADATVSANTHSCSACAACCSALGLPAHAVELPALPIEAMGAPLVLADVDSFVPGGLDRPPRARLA